MYKEDIELRKMPAGSLAGIISILETDDGWKKIMSKIPRDPSSEHFVPKYNEEHIRTIEKHAKDTGLKCTEILFDEWGTSGRIRPTLSTLKDVLYKTKDKLYRAAVEIALLLNEPLPQRPITGPAALITTDLAKIMLTEGKTRTYNTKNLQPASNNQAIFNQTTAEVGHDNATNQFDAVTDMIHFSEAINRPNLSILQREATTHVMEDSTSDNSGTSTNLPNLTILQQVKPNELSINIPNVIASMNTPFKDDTPEIKFTMTQSDIQSSNFTSQSMSQSPVFQTSMPNIEFKPNNSIDDSIFQETNLIKFYYSDLIAMTDNFSMEIGSGGFGVVFKGLHPQYGALAVKMEEGTSGVRRDKVVKAFITEVTSLSQLNHKNILPILGFSTDGPALCIISEYMEGGSLHDKIQEKVLNERQRIDIIIGTAEGLRYLHSNQLTDSSVSATSASTKSVTVVHGDVKSANILLTKDFVPKLCDFGLAKQCDVTFLMETRTVTGTSAYMAPERQGGTITQKSDIYSYGIVLWELLTGLEPIVNNNGEIKNIKVFIKDLKYDITQNLDTAVGRWTKAKEIHELARKCTKYNKDHRPSIVDVCNTLYKINSL